MPQASRRWSQLKTQWIMERFNKGEWQAIQSKQDPCLCIITKGNTKSYINIFCDDVECVGTCMNTMKEIAKEFDSEFAIKFVDAKFMLGVLRETNKEPNMGKKSPQ